jgi:hypothetical protein
MQAGVIERRGPHRGVVVRRALGAEEEGAVGQRVDRLDVDVRRDALDRELGGDDAAAGAEHDAHDAGVALALRPQRAVGPAREIAEPGPGVEDVALRAGRQLQIRVRGVLATRQRYDGERKTTRVISAGARMRTGGPT